MSDKRDEIIEVADILFYQKGFEFTSFADIAEKVGISRGNFYYHFKSKNDILDAVIERRINNTEAMLGQWELEGVTPYSRIQSFINILIMNQAKIRRYGCPVGTLTTELTKLDHSSAKKSTQLFGLFIHWLTEEFRRAGLKNQAEKLAKHLLARSQGIAILANAFDDEAFIYHEVKQLKTWLNDQLNSST